MEQIPQNDWHTIAEKRLGVLVGTRLTEMHRCLNMEMFGFGPLRPSVREFGPGKGTVVEHAEFSLHVQCPWRITKNQQIVMGEGDRRILIDWFDTNNLSPAEKDELPRLLERRVAEFQKLKPNGLLVAHVTIDQMKGLEIGFEENYVLTVFPENTSSDKCDEYWRYFSWSEEKHLVATFGIFAEESGE